MKTFLKFFALGVIVAAAGLHLPCTAEPALTDFGYGNMTTNRAIHSLIILANFTNNAVETSVTTPYRAGPLVVGTNFLMAQWYYSNWFFGNTVFPETGNGWFRENSNGRFTWLPTPVLMVWMDTNNLNAAILERKGGPGHEGEADAEYMTLIIQQAIARGLDLGQYDLPANGGNGDGVVSSRECVIQLLINDKTFGGGARYWGGTGGVTYAGDVTIQQFTLGLPVLAHELIHVLQAGHCGDIYGPSSMSDGFSIMSGSGLMHVDAWHKLQLAWCEPRIRSLRQSGPLVLSAAQLMDTNGLVILYDPARSNRNTQEFFVLEYRTPATSVGSGYDRDVVDHGLVIWHVQQNSGKDPVEYTLTYHPTGSERWRRCDKCSGMFRYFNKPCPAGGMHGVDVLRDPHLCLSSNAPHGEVSTGWRECNNCGMTFFQPNATSSVCAAGGVHQAAAGAPQYWIWKDDDPRALGQREWFRCSKCQSLVRGESACAAGGNHVLAAGSDYFTILWDHGVRTMMTEGSPDFRRSRGWAWNSGDVTPALRWFDGTSSSTRIRVGDFTPGADAITIEIEAGISSWVDFAYGGTEDGSFDHPFNTFAEGVTEVYPGGTLHIKAGTSSETRHVNKAMKIEPYGGTVKIGRQ